MPCLWTNARHFIYYQSICKHSKTNIPVGTFLCMNAQEVEFFLILPKKKRFKFFPPKERIWKTWRLGNPLWWDCLEGVVNFRLLSFRIKSQSGVAYKSIFHKKAWNDAFWSSKNKEITYCWQSLAKSEGFGEKIKMRLQRGDEEWSYRGIY